MKYLLPSLLPKRCSASLESGLFWARSTCAVQTLVQEHCLPRKPVHLSIVVNLGSSGTLALISTLQMSKGNRRWFNIQMRPGMGRLPLPHAGGHSLSTGLAALRSCLPRNCAAPGVQIQGWLWPQALSLVSPALNACAEIHRL